MAAKLHGPLPDKRMVRLTHASDALLGALLVEPSSFARIDVGAEDLAREHQREVFSVIQFLAAKGPFDVMLVTQELLRRDPGSARVRPYDHESWQEYIAKLYEDTPSAANIESYAAIVREESMLRRTRTVAMDFLNSEGEGGADMMIAQLMKISGSKLRRDRRLSDDIPAFIDSLDQLQRGDRPGLTTGIPRLDQYLGGWINSDLYLIAARSSMGKTAAMMNFSHSLLGVPHGIVSAEQPARQLLQRYCALIGEVNAQRIRLGQLEDDEWVKVSNALDVVAKAPIYVEDSSNISITEVAKVARGWKFRHGIKALFVDYAQRIRGVRRTDSRATEVGEVARGLKDIGRELDIPVIALAQVNREADKRANNKPMLSDLRESGDLEQEADSVIAIYRPSMYDDTLVDKRETELIILKNRHGPLGYTKVEFYHEFMRYSAYPEGDYTQGQREAFLQ